MVTLSTSSALFLAMYVDRWQMRCSKGVLGSYILVRDNEAERREVAVVKDNWVSCYHLREISSYQLVFSYVLSI